MTFRPEGDFASPSGIRLQTPMRADQGSREHPCWEGESLEHYMWRLATMQGLKPGAEPPTSYGGAQAQTAGEIKPSPADLFAERDPGEEG